MPFLICYTAVLCSVCPAAACELYLPAVYDKLLLQRESSLQEKCSGILQVQYRQIYRIVETKTNFYIMLSRNQGIIIVKANCLPELIGFLTQLKNTVKEQRS